MLLENTTTAAVITTAMPTVPTPYDGVVLSGLVHDGNPHNIGVDELTKSVPQNVGPVHDVNQNVGMAAQSNIPNIKALLGGAVHNGIDNNGGLLGGLAHSGIPKNVRALLGGAVQNGIANRGGLLDGSVNVISDIKQILPSEMLPGTMVSEKMVVNGDGSISTSDGGILKKSLIDARNVGQTVAGGAAMLAQQIKGRKNVAASSGSAEGDLNTDTDGGRSDVMEQLLTAVMTTKSPPQVVQTQVQQDYLPVYDKLGNIIGFTDTDGNFVAYYDDEGELQEYVGEPINVNDIPTDRDLEEDTKYKYYIAPGEGGIGIYDIVTNSIVGYVAEDGSLRTLTQEVFNDGPIRPYTNPDTEQDSQAEVTPAGAPVVPPAAGPNRMEPAVVPAGPNRMEPAVVPAAAGPNRMEPAVVPAAAGPNRMEPAVVPPAGTAAGPAAVVPLKVEPTTVPTDPVRIATVPPAKLPAGPEVPLAGEVPTANEEPRTTTITAAPLFTIPATTREASSATETKASRDTPAIPTTIPATATKTHPKTPIPVTVSKGATRTHDEQHVTTSKATDTTEPVKPRTTTRTDMNPINLFTRDHVKEPRTMDELPEIPVDNSEFNIEDDNVTIAWTYEDHEKDDEFLSTKPYRSGNSPIYRFIYAMCATMFMLI